MDKNTHQILVSRLSKLPFIYTMKIILKEKLIKYYWTFKKEVKIHIIIQSQNTMLENVQLASIKK